MARGINLTNKLGDNVLNNYDTKDPDLFGVEIELEGVNITYPPNAVSKDWKREQDGSLRMPTPGSEAWEYVLRQPLNYKDTKNALKVLFEWLNAPPCEVRKSYRTSIHVHVNCLQETIGTILNYITLAIIFDELFVSQNGETRIGNNFCLRSRDAEGQLDALIGSIRSSRTIFIMHNQLRYSSVNIVSLLKYGTLEFRSLECTTDLIRVLNWIEVLQQLKVMARAYENPRDIISKFSRHGVVGFMLNNLGEHFARYAKVPGAQQMVKDGMRLAQDLAYCSDWEPPAPVLEKQRIRPAKGAVWGANPAGEVQINAPPVPPPPLQGFVVNQINPFDFNVVDQ